MSLFFQRSYYAFNNYQSICEQKFHLDFLWNEIVFVQIGEVLLIKLNLIFNEDTDLFMLDISMFLILLFYDSNTSVL